MINSHLSLCSGIFPLRCSVLVIYKVHSTIGFDSLLPSIGQRSEWIVVWRSGYSGQGSIARNRPVVASSSVTLVWVEEPLVLHLQHLKCSCMLGNDQVLKRILISNSNSNLSSLALPTGKILQPLGVGSLPSGSPRIVIHIVDATPGISAHFPSRRKGLWALPSRAATVVIHIIPAPVLIKPGSSGSKFQRPIHPWNGQAE